MSVTPIWWDSISWKHQDFFPLIAKIFGARSTERLGLVFKIYKRITVWNEIERNTTMKESNRIEVWKYTLLVRPYLPLQKWTDPLKLEIISYRTKDYGLAIYLFYFFIKDIYCGKNTKSRRIQWLYHQSIMYCALQFFWTSVTLERREIRQKS